MAASAKVLIADDTPDHVELMRETLKSELDVEIDCVATGEECLKYIKKSRYNLLFLDYLLPKANGLDILREITKEDGDLPIVMVTGHGNEKIAVEAMKAGAVDYVVKSADGFAALPSIAKKVIEKNQLKKKLRDSEKRYEYLFEQSPVGIGLATVDGRVVCANKMMEVITGYFEEELKKINLADTYENPEDRKKLLETIDRYGCAVDFAVRLKRKDGTVYDALLNVSQVHLDGRDRFRRYA